MSRKDLDDGWRSATGVRDVGETNLAWIPRRIAHMNESSPPHSIGDVLKPGVYLLAFREKIVFVGRSRCLLDAITGHRSVAVGPRMPEWFPIKGIHFDDVYIYPTSWDRTLSLMDALIEFHKPPHNVYSKPAAQFPSTSTLPPITRRA